MKQVCLNGRFLDAEAPVHRADDRAYRYGDGFFETMMLSGGGIRLEDLHRQRFGRSLEALGMKYPAHLDWERLSRLARQLAARNHGIKEAFVRVRLSVSRGCGGIYEEPGDLNYLVETWSLDQANTGWNSNGLVLGHHPDVRKSMDRYSSLKTASALPYIMAARYAAEKKWNDCLVLNSAGRVADSTIANVFIWQQGRLITPPLSEGCVDGVMRRLMLELLPTLGIPVQESPLELADLLGAEEVMLTNAIRGVRWVRSLEQAVYGPFNAQKIADLVRGHLETQA